MITLTHSSCSVTGFNKQTEHSGSRKLDSETTRTTTHVEQNWVSFCLTPEASGPMFNHSTSPISWVSADSYRCKWDKKTSPNTGIFWMSIRKDEFKTSLSPAGEVTHQAVAEFSHCCDFASIHFFMVPLGHEQQIWYNPSTSMLVKLWTSLNMASINVSTFYFPSYSFFLLSEHFKNL